MKPQFGCLDEPDARRERQKIGSTRFAPFVRERGRYTRPMGKMMIGIAVALIVLGLGAYVGTGAVSVTALIPAFFGIALAGLGALGLKDRFRLPSAYGGIVLSVIGLSGSVSGIPKVIAYLGGEEVTRPAASIAQSIMAVILLVLIVSLVKFVIAERRQARTP